MFDCVLPTRTARTGSALTGRGGSISGTRDTPATRARSTRAATARPARGSRGPTSGTSSTRTSCSGCACSRCTIYASSLELTRGARDAIESGGFDSYKRDCTGKARNGTGDRHRHRDLSAPLAAVRRARAPPPARPRRRCRTASSSATRSSPPAASTRSCARSTMTQLRIEIAPGVIVHARPARDRRRGARGRVEDEPSRRGRAGDSSPTPDRNATPNPANLPRLPSRRSHLTLIVLLLVALGGVALLRCPSSPFHRRSSKGLDLQGGLEVVLRRSRRRGTSSTPAEISTARSTIMRTASTSSASPAGHPPAGLEPDRDPARRRPRPGQAAAIIGKTAQLELYDLTPALLPPSIDASGNADRRTRTSATCCSRVQATAKGDADGLLPLQADQGDDTGVGKKQEDDHDDVTCVQPKAGPTPTLHRDHVRPATQGCRRLRRQIPKG